MTKSIAEIDGVMQSLNYSMVDTVDDIISNLSIFSFKTFSLAVK